MDRYEHLPIYKKAMDVAVHFEKVAAGFSRYHKYTLGTDLRDQEPGDRGRDRAGVWIETWITGEATGKCRVAPQCCKWKHSEFGVRGNREEAGMRPLLMLVCFVSLLIGCVRQNIVRTYQDLVQYQFERYPTEDPIHEYVDFNLSKSQYGLKGKLIGISEITIDGVYKKVSFNSSIVMDIWNNGDIVGVEFCILEWKGYISGERLQGNISECRRLEYSRDGKLDKHAQRKFTNVRELAREKIAEKKFAAKYGIGTLAVIKEDYDGWKLLEVNENNPIPLIGKQVKSGDSIVLSSLFSSANKMSSGFLPKHITETVIAWGRYQGKKVLVTSIDSGLINLDKNSNNSYIRVGGYNLYLPGFPIPLRSFLSAKTITDNGTIDFVCDMMIEAE